MLLQKKPRGNRYTIAQLISPHRLLCGQAPRLPPLASIRSRRPHRKPRPMLIHPRCLRWDGRRNQRANRRKNRPASQRPLRPPLPQPSLPQASPAKTWCQQVRPPNTTLRPPRPPIHLPFSRHKPIRVPLLLYQPYIPAHQASPTVRKHAHLTAQHPALSAVSPRRHPKTPPLPPDKRIRKRILHRRPRQALRLP